MYKRILILFLLLFLYQAESNSQQYFFRKYSVEEGLPLASVYCIIEDSRGYLWMGTAGGGLACFDGNKFETFTKANGLSDNLIYTLCEDSKGNIWIGTVNGLTLYDGENFTVLSDEPVLREATIHSITEGSNGTIWVGTMVNGLVAIRNDDSLSVTKFTIGEDLLSNMIFDIYEDHDKRLWLAMGHGVNTLTFSETDPLAIENIDDYYFPDDMVLSVEQGADDEFWISIHNKGIFNISRKTESNDYEVVPSAINGKYPGLTVWDILLKENGEIWLATDENGIIRLLNDEVIGDFSRNNGLPSNQILNMMEDHEGNSWFASFGQGALMFGDEKFLEYGPSEGISGNQVFSIYVESDDLLYTATETGFTCYKREDSKITQLKSYSRPQGLNDVGATTLTKYRNNIWIGTNNGINIFNGTNLTGFEYNYLLPDLRISDLLVDNQNNLWIGTGGGYGKFTGDTMYLFTEDMGFINNEIQTIIEDSKERIWMGTFKGLVRLDTLYNDYNEEDGLTFTRINTLAEDPSGNIWIGTFGEGIFKYTDKSDTLPISFLAGKETLSSGTINSLFFINDSLLIAGTDKGFDLVELDSEQKIRNVIPYGRNDGFTGGEVNINAIARDNQGYIWFGTINGIIRFDPGIDQAYSSSSKTLITSIKLFFEDVDWESRNLKVLKWSGLPENLVLSHKDNHVTFEFTGFSYSNPDELMFSYKLERNGTGEWSPYTTARSVPSSDLPPGNYTFYVKSKNKYGITGETAEYSFIIKPPFWRTKWFLFSMALLIILSIILIIKYREKKLIEEKEKLEKIVEERTREVVEQKDEIAKQRDIVTYQKKEITDSIQYAERIQQAVLPEEIILRKNFADYFILFRPKDIVSGDFYWMSEKKGKIIFTAADCTGHGVPGAFMSMLGVSFLNKIVNESGISVPAKILNTLRENVIISLKQKGIYEETTKDGMDMALCSADLKNNTLQYAGANNPLILIRKVNGEYTIIEKRADGMPVGIYSRMSPFTNHELEIHKNDTIYLFSDGFYDQFGGPKGRKFMKPRFYDMLLEHQELDMSLQKEAFESTLDEWINYPSDKGHHIGQIDDIILVGIRI